VRDGIFFPALCDCFKIFCRYYPEAEEVYGKDVEAMVQDEDTMPIEQPIIQPIKEKQFDLVEANAPVVNFKKPFLLGLMETPALIRNIGLVGQMHCGKTSFLDTLVRETHKFPDSHEFERFWAGARQPKFCDSRIDEQKRGISIKSHPMAFVLSASSGKSYLLNVIDTPGHVNFSDECTSALRGCDGAVVCVDAVEGLMLCTQRSIRYCLMEGIPMLLNITKIDRLVIELKLPPADAFFKLRHVIDEVNSFIRTCPSHGDFLFSPELGNVVFASPTYGFSFTLQSFALKCVIARLLQRYVCSCFLLQIPACSQV
jgi:U5 small nuclear ribonucleoprotein component